MYTRIFVCLFVCDSTTKRPPEKKAPQADMETIDETNLHGLGHDGRQPEGNVVLQDGAHARPLAAVRVACHRVYGRYKCDVTTVEYRGTLAWEPPAYPTTYTMVTALVRSHRPARKMCRKPSM